MTDPGPTGPTGPAGPTGPYVEVAQVQPQGSDLLYVRGIVDDVPVEVYLPRQLVFDQRSNARRRYIAQALRRAKPDPTPPPALAALLGREDGV